MDTVDFVMFTGSTRTGRAVAARAGERLMPCSLELGGKDALIVLPDADIERAVDVALHGALVNGGQMCTSVERCYVEAPVYDRFVTRLRERFEEVTQARPAGPGSTDVGALTFPRPRPRPLPRPAALAVPSRTGTPWQGSPTVRS
ncbi:aldehyde dehydrogenase family protein [Streptomyces sviceus]|uniref:aldehyde dehydrogenase family protein n=1 Tax=Streptomyces sviceus TaxID=285530 RepID=UPI00381EE3FB